MPRKSDPKYPAILPIRADDATKAAVRKIAKDTNRTEPDAARYLLLLGMKMHADEQKLLEQIRASRSQIDISALATIEEETTGR